MQNKPKGLDGGFQWNTLVELSGFRQSIAKVLLGDRRRIRVARLELPSIHKAKSMRAGTSKPAEKQPKVQQLNMPKVQQLNMPMVRLQNATMVRCRRLSTKSLGLSRQLGQSLDRRVTKFVIQMSDL